MKKVLIFDDDDDILDICTHVLKDAGWQVRTYTDCGGLISRVRSYAPNVILMDNWIPHEGGVVATQTLKANPELRSIPVIYFSANSNIESLAEAAGADFVLPKPFDLEELIATVRKAMVEA